MGKSRQEEDKRSMKFLVTGASGLVGTALLSFLHAKNHEVYRLVRQPNQSNHTIYWNPVENQLAPKSLENFEGVVHLAGENIASGPWTSQKKEKILQSRLKGTQLLSQTLATLKHPPSIFISASAMGYYGHRGDEILDEESHAGVGFLSQVAQQWEAATQPAQQAGIRVVQLRLGMILSNQGGAFPKIKRPFELGLGGRVGEGRQYISWIALADVIGIVEHILKTENLQGPVNATAPHPVTNTEFSKVLGRVFKRPTLFSVPAFAIRLILGEMGEELILSSIRVKPKRLLETGYSFQYNLLEEALHHLMQKH